MEALIAGAIPNIIPIATEKPKAKATDHKVTVETSKIAITMEANIPKAMPIIPPVTDSIIASSRNCFKMSFLFAPKAFRSQISFVRSVTETSMILATPIPPTKREMAAIPPSAKESMLVILDTVSAIDCPV